MNERKLTNDHDIIVYTLFLSIRWFQKEDNIFAAQCVWWLASIIQYTEILNYYVQYQTFPSEYVRDCILTPLPSCDNEGTIIPESDIPVLNLNRDSDIEEQLSEEELRIDPRINTHNKLNTTRSGRVFNNKPKYREPTLLELEQCFGSQSSKQWRRTRDLLRAEYKDTWRINWRRLRTRRNIADSIWTPHLSRKLRRGSVKIRVNIDCTINGQKITAKILINYRD